MIQHRGGQHVLHAVYCPRVKVTQYTPLLEILLFFGRGFPLGNSPTLANSLGLFHPGIQEDFDIPNGRCNSLFELTCPLYDHSTKSASNRVMLVTHCICLETIA